LAPTVIFAIVIVFATGSARKIKSSRSDNAPGEDKHSEELVTAGSSSPCQGGNTHTSDNQLNYKL